MARPTRSDDWGFPRWRPYGAKGRAAARVRLCDREGCNEPGDRPAPKAPHSRERWMFCEAHAAEYNKNWNYFAGLTAEEAAKRAAEEESGAAAYRRLAKEHHPDRHKGDKEAAKRFHAVQAAYEVLRRAEERKTGVKV